MPNLAYTTPQAWADEISLDLHLYDAKTLRLRLNDIWLPGDLMAFVIRDPRFHVRQARRCIETRRWYIRDLTRLTAIAYDLPGAEMMGYRRDGQLHGIPCNLLWYTAERLWLTCAALYEIRLVCEER